MNIAERTRRPSPRPPVDFTLASVVKGVDDPHEQRGLVLPHLKKRLAEERARLKAELQRAGNGRDCAAALSGVMDDLIRAIHTHTVANVYPVANPSDAEQMAIVATGGYGRGLLAPGSDIDLLFLFPYKQTPWGESVAEYMLYLLWDLGLKVGHATRNVDQCLKMAEADLTIRTTLLDCRLILGEAPLLADLERRLREGLIKGSARAFVDAKMAERDERHRRTGESRYLVEPNVKDGKGGLRDLHTLHWLSKYLIGHAPDEAAAGTFFTASDRATFRRCADFLWTVRCHLHFMTNRAVERLSFEHQRQMAEELGYKSHGGLLAVERFMKHYFLVAKDVGDLTAVLSSALEQQQVKTAPRLDKLLARLNWKTRRWIRAKTEFRIENDRITVADQEVFKRDPVNLIRIFAYAEETGAYFDPNAMRLVRNSLRLIDDKVRTDPVANEVFLALLTSKSGPEATLRQMNEAGVLGRFVPEFQRVVSMMQFNMYHHYTVDEHLLRTVGELKAIEDGKLADTLPLSSEIIGSIQNRRALYVAAFLHDIGKGRPQDHSVIGAEITRDLAPRLGLSDAEVELVVWLVRQHLTMSEIAQSRDLGDPKTIDDFADIVQSPERLKLLLLLTVADIRAVGPGTWNGWKGQLLRTLYYEAEPRVAGGHTLVGRRQREAEAQAAVVSKLAHWPKDEADRFLQRHYPDYWLRTETRKIVEHGEMIRRAEASGVKLATSVSSNAFTAITELSVLAPNHPRLLALLAGCCAATGANIAGAHISTTRDGFALDTFLLQRELPDDADELRRGERIGQTIEKVLEGELRLTALLAKRKPAEKRIEAFSVVPEIVINNSLSDRHTVIEVAGLDRPGLLYELTSALSDLSLDIGSAHITTYGEKAVDVFYVTDLTHKKIDQPARQKAIRQRLEPILAGQQAPAETSKG
jgi:[protein-PII] uridylyltransferase